MKKKFIVLLLAIIFMPINVYAVSGNLNISCDPIQVKPGESTECLIKGNITDTDINRLEISLSKSENVIIEGFTPENGWIGSDISNGKIVINREEGVTGTFNIGKLNVKINSNTTSNKESIYLNNSIFYINETEYEIDNTGVDITISSVETPVVTGLESLKITGGTLGRTFDSTIKGYNIILDSASTTTFGIEATARNSEDDIKYYAVTESGRTTISNPKNITFTTDEGKQEMEIDIIVGSGDKAETYILTIIKPTVTSSTGELSKLTVGGVNVKLSSGVYTYNVYLNDTSSFQVIADLTNSDDYKIENFTSPTTMYSTEFTINVVPKVANSGLTSYTYIIKVNKLSNDNGESNNNINNNISNNPTTGISTPSIVVSIVLVLSFGLTLYLYRKNVAEYN